MSPEMAASADPDLSDWHARRAALIGLDRSLLMGAAAGSGKTSVLAGRAVGLLAAGRHPSNIAAISYTELSAAELRGRIRSFVDRLLVGDVPRDIEAGFAPGLSVEQGHNLRKAKAELDDLICTTVHGFCRILLTPYPVEAGIDPGASMMDRDQADLLLEDVHDRWLRLRLSGRRDPSDVFVAIHLAQPSSADRLLRLLVRQMLAWRGMGVPKHPSPYVGAEVLALRRAVLSFASVFGNMPGWAPLEFRLAGASVIPLVEGIPGETATEADMLAFALGMEVPPACATGSGSFGKDPTVGTTQATWKRAAAAVSETVAKSKALSLEAKAAFDAVRDAFEAVMPSAAPRILHVLAGEARHILEQYEEAKRAAAALDFGDLLEKTRKLLASHGEVRAGLAERFRHVLVDEFQDTDAEQAEIFWRLCGDFPAGSSGLSWREATLRPGALFLVGDPQQSIYRFRGADLSVFLWAKAAMKASDPASILSITRNFRSRASILHWVNGRFGPHLSAEGQCGFAPLAAAVEAELATPGVAALDVVPTGTTADDVRDAEADAVARACAAIIGNLDVRGDDGASRKCRPGDIALVVPTGTELWRYERALEENGLSVAAEAGKGFFRRQEVQDLIALTRTLADGRDRLAFGALLRGPLVGLTDAELLDAVESLPPDPNGKPPALSLRMELPDDAHPVLRSRLTVLRALSDGRNRTTPHLLLCRAVEEMGVRAVLRARGGRVAERALANVDMFLEMSRAYSVRGLRAFSDAMRAQWEDAQRMLDGRHDADGHSVNLITMHTAKGLEWPVVIPVNTLSKPNNTIDMACDREAGLLHVPVFGERSEACRAAFEAEKTWIMHERQRLWYVAATRARDLLLMPRLSGGVDGAWCSLIGFDLGSLEPFRSDLPPDGWRLPEEPGNPQDVDRWTAEARAIEDAMPAIRRRMPSLAEDGDLPPEPWVAEDGDALQAAAVPGGLRRGLVLHKLIEEVLTGETPGDADALAARCTELAEQLTATPGPVPEPAEAAACVARALSLPEIAAVRHLLVPEWNVSASLVAEDGTEELVLGVADAVVPDGDGPPALVVDWKSDVEPDGRKTAGYLGQLSEYLRATGAREGLLVFITTGVVLSVAA